MKKWTLVEDVYENGEVICSNEVLFQDKEIYFDSMEEAMSYGHRYIDGEFSSTVPLYSMFEDNDHQFISYEEVKRILAEEAEKRRLYLKPCPFCGKTPQRLDTIASCSNCNINLPDNIWNIRKYHYA